MRSVAKQRILQALGLFFTFGLGSHACTIINGERHYEEIHPVDAMVVPADPECAEFASSPMLRDQFEGIDTVPLAEMQLRWLTPDEFMWHETVPLEHSGTVNEVVKQNGGMCVWLHGQGERVDGKVVLDAPAATPGPDLYDPECSAWAEHGGMAFDLAGSEIVYVKSINRCVVADCAYADQYDDLGDPDPDCVLPNLRPQE